MTELFDIAEPVLVDTEAEELLPIPAHAWKRAFVLDLMKHGILVIAARNIGKRIRDVAYARKMDPDFDLYVKEAIELAKGELEYEARRRALAGSDFLLVKMLEANLPETYGKNAAPTGDIFVKAYIGWSPDAWDEQIKNKVVEGEVVQVQPHKIIDESEHKTNSSLPAPSVAVPVNE